MFDKRALAMGEPTSIRGDAGQAEALRVEDLNRYLEQLPSCKPGDSESTGPATETQETGTSRDAEATQDATQPQPGPDAGTVADPPAAA